jgi:hypothetical protein
MNEPIPNDVVSVLPVPEQRAVGINPMVDVLNNSLPDFETVTIDNQDYELRVVRASHPYTLGEHLIIFPSKPVEKDSQGKTTKLIGVIWEELNELPELQAKLLVKFTSLIAKVRSDSKNQVIGEFHLGYANGDTINALDGDKNKFQTKPAFSSLEPVHLSVVEILTTTDGQPQIQHLPLDQEPKLAVKKFDLAGIAAAELFEGEIEKLNQDFVFEETVLPVDPNRKALKFADLKKAMMAAYELQVNTQVDWIEAIKAVDGGLGQLLIEKKPDIATVLLMHKLLRDEVKQFVVPGMLVVVDEQNQSWLVPYTAGNSAAEWWGRYEILRAHYDDHYYNKSDVDEN